MSVQEDTCQKHVLTLQPKQHYLNGLYLKEADLNQSSKTKLINIKLMIRDLGSKSKLLLKTRHPLDATLVLQEDRPSAKWEASKIHSQEQ